MKRSLSLMFLCAMLLMACTKEPDSAKKLSINNSGTTIAITEESEISIYFTLTNGTKEDYVSDYTTAEWLTVISKTTEIEGNNLKGKAICRVSQNDEGVDREAQVCFVYKDQVVKHSILQDHSPSLPEPM